MKKLISLVLVFTVLFNLIGCSNSVVDNSSNSASEVVIDTTSEEKNNSIDFIVGFDAEYPPYGYMDDDGSYTGFDLELAKEVCSRNNWNYIPRPIDWDSKDLELNSENITCIWNGFTMTGRENNYTFTIPYVDNSIVVACNKDSDINTLNDLSGKIINVQQGSSALSALEEDDNKDLTNSFADLVQVPDYNTAFMNLQSGACDAIIVDTGVAQYQIANNNNFKILDDLVSTEQYSIGFKKGNIVLKDAVEKTIVEMYKDGTFMNIANKYKSFNLPEMICIDKYIK